MKHKNLTKALIIFLVVTGVFANAIKVQAFSKDSNDYKKAITTALSACYADNAFIDPIGSSYSGKLDDVVRRSNSVSEPFPQLFLPGGLVSCSEVLQTAMDWGGVSLPKYLLSAQSALENIGYYTEATDKSGQCFYFQFKVTRKHHNAGTGEITTSTSTEDTNYVCAETDANGFPTSELWVDEDHGNNDVLSFKKVKNKPEIKVTLHRAFSNKSFTKAYSTSISESSMNGFMKDIAEEFVNGNDSKYFISGGGEGAITNYELVIYNNGSVGVMAPLSASTTEYHIRTNAKNDIPSALTGVPMQFFPADIFTLYQNYLLEYYDVEAVAADPDNSRQEEIRTSTTNNKLGGYTKTKFYADGHFFECYVKPTKNKKKKVTSIQEGYFGGIDLDTRQFPKQLPTTDFAGIAAYLLNSSAEESDFASGSRVLTRPTCAPETYTEQEGTPAAGAAAGNNGTGNSLSSNQDNSAGHTSSDDINKLCMQQKSAETASWLVCPAVDGLAKGSDGMYAMLKGMLEVDPGLAASGSATFDIWSTIRNFANIAFMIVLLIIIFSQLTGIGIDNYGIKKILPKLIIAALLINLSFIICQFAVDLSNIVGNSLSLLLSGIAEGIDVKDSVNIGAVIEGVASTATIAASGIGFAAVEMIPVVMALLTITGGGLSAVVIIVPIILMLLIAIIAIVVFFVTLALQKILVVVCIVLSPLAFACYMLPNTQDLFKKWFTLFKAVLLLFPICSALYGIGVIVKVIIFRSSTQVSFWVAALAMAAPLLPYFLVPTLLRKAMAMAGDIGAKIQGIGASAKQGLRNTSAAVQGSDLYKDTRFLGQKNLNEKMLNKVNAKLADGKEHPFLKAQQNILMRRGLAYEKEELDRFGVTAGNFESRMASIDAQRQDREINDRIASLRETTNNYDLDTMNDQLRRIRDNPGPMTAEDGLTMKALMRQMLTRPGGKGMLMKTISGADLEGKGGRYREGTHRPKDSFLKSASQFMSRESGISSAVMDKGAMHAQYLSDINAGRAYHKDEQGNDTEELMDFSEWYGSTRGNTGKTNAQFVVEDIADKDEMLFTQSGSEVDLMLGATNADGSHAFSDERLNRILQNEQLMGQIKSAEVLQRIIAAADNRGIVVPDKYRVQRQQSDTVGGLDQSGATVDIPGDTGGSTYRGPRSKAYARNKKNSRRKK